jgi:DNA-binding NarL/FixJ family response regulator
MSQAEKKIRIAIADDQHLFRQSLELLIGSVDNFQLVASAENGASLLQLMGDPQCRADVALIDLNMPGIDGVELNAILHNLHPAVKVVVLTIYASPTFIVRAIEDGAAGYLLKNCDKDELTAAINAVMKTGFYLNALTMEAIRKGSQFKARPIKKFNNIPVELTERENEILLFICREFSNAEIARELSLSIRTVEGHRNNLLLKTGCRNSAGLVMFALKHGLFQIPFS